MFMIQKYNKKKYNNNKKLYTGDIHKNITQTGQVPSVFHHGFQLIKAHGSRKRGDP